MTSIMNFLKTIRNNWKKSVAGAAALSYGVSYGVEKYDTHQLMREYCEEATKYGDEPLPVNSRPRQMIVVLNPVANKRNAKSLFEKYCEPLLHLAGIAITVIQTESEGQARHILSNLDSPTDAVIVAGGDGTLSDVVTGLMRRYQRNIGLVKQCPIGILPLGQTNTIAGSLYQGYENLNEVRALADATMAIVKGNTKSLDTVEVEPLEQDPENIIKSVYALGAIEWGAWKDAHARIDKYWYYGSLRKYATYIFSGYKTDLSWECNAKLRYTDPCNGCSHCYKEKLYSNASTTSNQRWWHVFLPRKKIYSSENEIDYSKVINENCGNFHEISVSTTELRIETLNAKNIESEAKSLLDVKLAPKTIDYSKFVAEGWKRAEKNETLIDQEIYAKEIELYPQTSTKEGKETMFYIDNEEFELKPVKIKLLQKSINIFCPESKR